MSAYWRLVCVVQGAVCGGRRQCSVSATETAEDVVGL